MTNNVIAEIKPRDPFQPKPFKDKLTLEERVKAYEEAGVFAISVHTDPRYGGSMELLEKVRGLTDMIVMAKGFYTRNDQINELADMGIDGLLLIAADLIGADYNGDDLMARIGCASYRDMWALVETRNTDEIQVAIYAGAGYIGANNRIITTGKISMKRSIFMGDHIPLDVQFVSESGFMTPDDITMVKSLSNRKPDIYLIGTALMESEDPKTLLEEFMKA